jgi:hypothetical protein
MSMRSVLRAQGRQSGLLSNARSEAREQLILNEYAECAESAR